MRHGDLERAIDETARQMTAGEPGAAFTSKVLARLDEGPAHRTSLWRRTPWVLAPVAAAAIIAIAAFVTLSRTGRPSRPGPFGPGAANTEAGPKGPALQAQGREVTGPEKPATQTANQAGPQGTPLQIANQAAPQRAAPGRPAPPPASGIDPLVPSSIAVALLAGDPIVPMDAIQPEPLHAPVSLTLAPLDSDDVSQRRFK